MTVLWVGLHAGSGSGPAKVGPWTDSSDFTFVVLPPLGVVALAFVAIVAVVLVIRRLRP